MTRQEFIKAWIQHFAPNLSRKQYELLKDGYIWHLFSYEMIPKENFWSEKKLVKHTTK